MNMHVFKRAFKDLWGIAKDSFLILTFLSLLQSASPLLSFYYMARVLDLLALASYNQVFPLIMQYLAIFFLMQGTVAWLDPIWQRKDVEIKRKIDSLPSEKMMTMNFHYADQASTQEKLTQVRRDQGSNNSSFSLIYQHSTNLIRHLVALILSLVMLAPLWQSQPTGQGGWNWVNSPWLNWALIALVIAVIFIQAVITQSSMAGLTELGPEILQINNTYYHYGTLLKESESGKEVRLYGLYDLVMSRVNHFYQWAKDFYQDLFNKYRQVQLFAALGSHLIQLAIYALVGLRVLSGALTVGRVIQLTAAINQLVSSLNGCLNFLTIFSQPEPMMRFYELIDMPDETAKGSIPVEKRLDNHYQLSVHQLSFAYPESDTQVLQDISADFQVGKRYAIVGENGSGKTTFIKVLMRLYEPSSGNVQLNHIDADKYSLQEYYQLFSVVFQDFKLLGLTLGENVAFNHDYQADLVKNHLSQVGLENWLSRLPQGLETYLGTEYDKSGVNISDGQAQKIALARALYKDAPIMILDEPTAALDPVSEFEVYQLFDQMVQDKTAFYISHRLSSCRFCDEILVFDQGRIIQRGDHQTLVSQPGKYQDLWQAQAQYYQ